MFFSFYLYAVLSMEGPGIGAQPGEPQVHEEADRLHAGPGTL